MTGFGDGFGEGLRALALGAHPDDVEYGCFGTLQRFDVRHIVVMSAGESGGSADQRRAEAKEASDVIGAELHIADHVDTALRLPDTIDEIAAAVERVRPDVVFTMIPADEHQDHATVAQASTVALRRFPGLVLGYPTPSLSHSAFTAQALFAVDEDRWEAKLAALACHRSQAHRSYLTPGYLETTARYWALAAGCEGGRYEPFSVTRWVQS